VRGDNAAVYFHRAYTRSGGFLTGLELVCRTRGDVGLMREHEVLALAPEKTQDGTRAAALEGE
jgi:hypothetical protein